MSLSPGVVLVVVVVVCLIRLPGKLAAIKSTDRFDLPDSKCRNPQDFQCNPGDGDSAPICINAASVCNGARDCPDGSDEVDCDFWLCKEPQWFRCRSGRCFSSAFRCDGHNDCPHHDDESDCDSFVAHHEPTVCTADQFRCAADGLCITQDYECDGERHCLDGSDEHEDCERALDAARRCQGGFVCKNLKCLTDARWRCDGTDDCGDGSDETGCMVNCTLPNERFACSDGRTCLTLDRVCDGVADCPAQADDEGGACEVYRNRTCEVGRCPREPAGVNCVVMPSGPQCVCPNGYIHNATTNVCEDIDECTEYGRCTQGCTNTLGSYRCTCTDRFRLRSDGRTCTLSRSTRSEAVIIYAGSTSVMALQLTSMHQTMVTNRTDHVVGVSYDGRFVYWTDIATTSESIARARINGSDFERVLTAGLSAPEDIAVDWVTGNLYLTDRGIQHIGVCSGDGLHCATLLSATIDQPRSIVLVPQRGQLYWTDWSERRPIIGRVAMDGAGAVEFVTENLNWPNGVTVDWPNQRVYWVDAKLQHIESIGMDGRNRRVVLDRVLKHPHGIAVFENSIYWSDWQTKSVQRCDKFTCKNRETVTMDRVIYDIHIYHKALQPKLRNPCETSKCSHLCLLAEVTAASDANVTFSCACPAGWALDVDHTKCSPLTKPQKLIVAVGTALVELEHRSFGRQVLSEPMLIGMHIDRLALNTLNGEVFVASNVERAIYMVNLQTLRTTLMVGSVGEVTAMAFDHLGNNLFWSDTERGTVEVLALRTHRQAIVHHWMGTSHPIALVALPEHGQLIVAVRNLFGHTHFVRMPMSGRGDHHLVLDDGIGADNIQLVSEPETEQLYWLDGELQRIMFTDFEFQMNHSFINNLDHPIDMAILDDEVFWTTEYSSSIYWAPKHRPTDFKRMTIDAEPFRWKRTQDKLRVLAMRAKHTINGHPCAKANICSDVCVPSTSSADRMACLCAPGRMFKDASNHTCVEAEECSFRCRSSGECLAQSRQCDDRKDCADGSDEDGCDSSAAAAGRVRLSCSFDEFQCTDASMCIRRDKICDHHFDCPDGSDESDCAAFNRTTRCRHNQFQCLDGLCIDETARCDGSNDCAAAEDEHDCGVTPQVTSSTVTGRERPLSRCERHGEFGCTSGGQCIPHSWHCDGHADCTDASDEHGCPVIGCPPTYFRCTFGQCIARQLVCDGHNHCGDNSDELHCGDDEAAATACGEVDAETKQPTRFQCASNRRLCLPLAVRCNGTAECPRGEDEAGCGQCQLNQFECQNGHCVRLEFRCDGQDDCGDGSDEINCTTSTTSLAPFGAAACDPHVSYDCGNGECIDVHRVCDGRNDCAAGQDEGGLCSATCDVCQHKCQQRPQGALCSCNDGFQLAADRRSCVDVDECREREPCAQLCDNTAGSFRCSCFVGYMLQGDKQRCKAIERDRYMLFSSFDTIYNTTARTFDVLWSSNGSRITGMSVNVAAGLLYFTVDNGAGALYEYTLRTGVIRYIPNVGVPRRVAVDWSTNNVYYVDEYAGAAVRVCHMAERVRVQLFQLGQRDVVKALSVDPLNGRLFYAVVHFADSLGAQSAVYAHALDGTRRELVSSDDGPITALELDPRKRVVFYAVLTTRSVWRVRYDGTDKQRMFGGGAATETAIVRPMAVRLSEDRLYVFNVGTTQAAHCEVYGERRCKTFDISVYNAEHLVVVQAVGQKHVTNVCAGHNCTAICVPAPKGPKCLCYGGQTVEAGEICRDGGGRSDRRHLVVAGQPTATTGGAQSTTGRSWWNILMICGAIIGCVTSASLGYYVIATKKLNPRKFVASVHFHNPVSDFVQQRRKASLPEMCTTRRYNEIFLNDLSTEEMCDATSMSAATATTTPPGAGAELQSFVYNESQDDRLTTHLIDRN